MKVPRFKLWALVVLVALAAVVLGVYITVARSRTFRIRGAFHMRELTRYNGVQQYCLANAISEDARGLEIERSMLELDRANEALVRHKERLTRLSGRPRKAAQTEQSLAAALKGTQELADLHFRTAKRYRASAARARSLGDYHRRQMEKYRRAAKRPWLPIEPGAVAPRQ